MAGAAHGEIGARWLMGSRQERTAHPRRPDSVEGTWRVARGATQTLSDYLLYRRHLFAYETASQRAGSWRTAVDLPCGQGDGFSLLRRTGKRVVAIDLAREALRALPDDADRLQADATRIPLADNCVDLFVSFQLIEHVPTESAVQILEEIKRVLRPGGRGFVTTPNARWRLLPGQSPWNPYHVREYRPREIVRLCQRVGVERDAIFGVVGVNGADAIEHARVRQNPFVVYGGHHGARLHRAMRRIGIGWRDELPSDPAAPIGPEHEATNWFNLSPDFEKGLDFWVEILGA